MFPGEFRLLEHIEEQYECPVSDVLQRDIPEYIPPDYRVVDNTKLLEGFISNKYVSCNRKSLQDEGAKLEIQPPGRDALQRYREHMDSIAREKRAEKRDRLVLAVAFCSLIVAIVAVFTTF